MLVFKRNAISAFNSTFERSSLFPKDIDDHGDDLSDGVMGSASDYILIAMIVAMMICMAVCCLCLFCRSSHFTLCGWNLEISNRSASVNIDDLTELHEVVPLTPTAVDTYNLSDIEKKLKSDPPPPKYNEVMSKSVLERFRRRSKRRNFSSDEDKSIVETMSNTYSDVPHDRRRQSEKRSLSSWFFQRSISYQPPQVSSWKASTLAKTSSCIEEEGQQTSRVKHTQTLPKSASDCLFEQSTTAVEHTFKPAKDFRKDIQSKKEIQYKSVSSKNSDFCQEHSSGSCDDEVFM